MSLEFAQEPGNPCYGHDAEFIEETQYCVINQKEYPESQMLFIPSQHEWVCLDSIDLYLHLIYTHDDLCVYHKKKNEIDKLLYIRKK